MAKAIMIQGTGSGAGKSVIVAGLCRIFRDLGIKVAPFKAQNMALNSFITAEGGEIGRAQAFQAEAAGIEPCNDMNPVLLKASSEAGCQVILNGKVHANMRADEYYAIKEKAWDVVTDAYDRLSARYDLIVIEGAGSPAEINLREEEIVNMKMARYADAPVVLVGDIDKGGVFASFYGTVALLKDPVGAYCDPPVHDNTRLQNSTCDAEYIKAFIINKFRGDREILRPGLRMIEQKTGKPVIGTIHYMGDLGLHEEDAIPVERFGSRYRRDFQHSIKIVVLGLRYISNFTDFDPFLYEEDVELRYSLDEADINSADMIMIPGSKNTVSDLLFLREHGIEHSVQAAARRGVPLVGICGGYQMLGQSIRDPLGVESAEGEVRGMGLLDTVTTLDKIKTTCQVSAHALDNDIFDPDGSPRQDKGTGSRTSGLETLRGYEIHMGNTSGDLRLFHIYRSGSLHPVPDGSAKNNVWGTYIHGLFDNDAFRLMLLNSLRKKRGFPAREEAIHYHSQKEKAIDNWAGILKNNVDICFILRQVGMEDCMQRITRDIS